jgi:dihydrofolate reductase
MLLPPLNFDNNMSGFFHKLLTNPRVFIIVGRLNWNSIPARHRPMRKRVNIVLSSTMTPPTDADGNPQRDVFVCRSFDEIITLLTSADLVEKVSGRNLKPFFSESLNSLSFSVQIETVWNIGGRALYEWGMNSPYFHRLYFTRIHSPAYPQCDVFFPTIDWTQLTDVSEAVNAAEAAGRWSDAATGVNSTMGDHDENKCVAVIGDKSNTHYAREHTEKGAVYSFHVYERKVAF